MCTLDNDLLALTAKTVSTLDLPPIKEVVLPERMLSVSEAQAKHDKFGVVVLEDGSAGFFYRLLDTRADQIEAYRDKAQSLTGCSLTDAAQLLESDDAFHRALALGAINAATHALLHASGFQLPAKISDNKTPRPSTKTSTANATTTNATTAHQQSSQENVPSIGMVGYFRQQVESLRAQGNRVVVLELNPAFHTEQPDLHVSNDIASLDSCERIYCTASTLINNTLEGLLEHFSALALPPHIEVVGPSAGCFPDVLFKRGATVVGGSLITDTEKTCERIRLGEPWLDAARKFSLSKDEYPGIDKLLQSASR